MFIFGITVTVIVIISVWAQKPYVKIALGLLQSYILHEHSKYVGNA